MRIGMVGAGGIARRHLVALQAQPGIEIAAHVASRPPRAEEAAAGWGGRAYTDVAEMLARENVEAVWVCVPPGAHGALEHDLIARGIPFFVEKPLDADCRTAEDIAEAVTRRGLVTAAGYHWRALDTLPAVRATLAEWPARMVIGSWLTVTPPPAWWSDPIVGGGQMVEQATHLLDLSRFLLGEAEVVAGMTAGEEPVAGASAALLRFESGAIGSYTASHLLRRTAAVYLSLVCPGLLITITQDAVTFDDGEDVRVVQTGADPIAVEDRAFLVAVREGDPSAVLCDYADALRSHRLACWIREMAEG